MRNTGRLACALAPALLAVAGCATTDAGSDAAPAASAATAAAAMPGTTAPPGATRLPGYIPQGQIPDSTRLLPPPPEPGSAAQAYDESLRQAAQALRGTPRWDLATLDASMRPADDMTVFSCTLGIDVNPQDTPNLYRLLQRAKRDGGQSTTASKNLYQRTRPYVMHNEPTCAPGDEAVLRNNGSYPSGHTASGWTAALVLTEVVPDLATEIMARGRAYGESRVVCNFHWQSDVMAARTAATATVARMRAEPEYNRDVALAREEVAAVRARGLPPKRDCAAEKAGLAMELPGVL